MHSCELNSQFISTKTPSYYNRCRDSRMFYLVLCIDFAVGLHTQATSEADNLIHYLLSGI